MAVLDGSKKKRRSPRRFPPLGERTWYNLVEAAERMQMSPVGLQRLIADGALAGWRVTPRGPWRIEKKIIDRIAEFGYAAAGLTAPPPNRARQPGMEHLKP